MKSVKTLKDDAAHFMCYLICAHSTHRKCYLIQSCNCATYLVPVTSYSVVSWHWSCSYIQLQKLRPVQRGGSLGSYEPPSSTCGKQKSEPNHFVAVQDLIEGSELEASLKRFEVSSYALYAPHCPPFCYDIIG